MANQPPLSLFLIFTTLNFITTTTVSTAVNSTKPTTNTLSTTAINSTIPTTYTNNTTNSTKHIPTTVISRAPTTNTAVEPTTTSTTNTTVNPTKPTTTNTTMKPTKPTVTASFNSITPQELDILLETLRLRGYSLFSNAISTSDVQFQLLSSATSSPSFTIFAPKDHFLYTLDMATDADAYVAALKCHVIPSRQLTIRQLTNLSTPYLDTLLPHYSVLVGKSKTHGFQVTVDGVRVSDPDLYVGWGFAVHGLDGILLTGFNMYEDTTGAMGRGFFSPGDASAAMPRRVAAPSLAATRMGGFSRAVKKQRKLQHRRVWRKDYF